MPRYQHYYFAHKFLPKFFYRFPLTFIRRYESKKDELLHEIWKICGEAVKEGEHVATDGLHVVPVEEPPYTGIVFIMPPVVNPCEAIMMFAVGRLGKGWFGRLKLFGPKYFTLEKAFTEDDSKEEGQETFLCMRTPNGGHVNYDHEPVEPEIHAFVKACLEYME